MQFINHPLKHIHSLFLTREIAESEASHLIISADNDKDGKLSVEEIVTNYDVFVGSEATSFGEQLKTHLTDEL